MSVQEFMQKTGIPLFDSGYEALKMAIEMRVEMPEMKIIDIYKNVGIKTGKSWHAIEKLLERAISKYYPRMDAGLKRELFAGVGKITTGNFIRAASYAIRNGLI